jgi:hypothetical protein
MNTYSILRNKNLICVEAVPFPHIVIKDALPKEFADALTRSFPLNSFDLTQNNKRMDISIGEHHEHHNIPELWKDFMLYHSSQEFFYEALDIFHKHIKQYPRINELTNSRNIKVGRRKIDSFKESDILLDAQISINTPVTRKSSVRKIHVDSEKKIFSGLVYLRQPNDDSLGGHLNLYSWKSDYLEADKVKHYQEGVEEKHLTLSKTIKYENNVAVLFLNSIDALHGVTIREETPHPRTFINLVSECAVDLYDKYQPYKRFLIKCRSFLGKLSKFAS